MRRNTDKVWREEHHIAASNLYYQIRRLRKMACEIPKPEENPISDEALLPAEKNI